MSCNENSQDQKKAEPEGVRVVRAVLRTSPIRRGTGGLDHDSVIFCEEITTLDMDFLSEGPLGDSVPGPLLRRVVRSVRIAIGAVPMPGE